MRGDGTVWLDKGSSTYMARYYHHGKPQTFSTEVRATGDPEHDKTRARKVLRKRVALALAGRPVPEDTRRLRYEDLAASLTADYRMNGLRSLKDLPRVLARLAMAFGGWPVLSITTARIQAYTVARLDEGAKPATVNKELSALGRMFTLAVRDGRMQYRPPVPKLRVQNARTGFVEPADFDAFLAALPEHLRAPTHFAYLSAWRRSEVLALTWGRVTLEADGSGTIRLDAAQSKNDSGRVLPFVPGSPLAVIFAEQSALRRIDCAHVFHRNGKPLRSFYDSWRKASAAVGQPNLLFHDLRRSAVRNMVRAGVSQHVAMKRSGHKTDSVFRRYDIVSEADLRDADEKVSTYLRTVSEPSVNRQSGRHVVAITEKRGA